MRLWCVDMIPYLPNSQILAQKREVDLIWKDIAEGRKTNHILINYIWEYENYKLELFLYYTALYKEFCNRHLTFNTSKNCDVRIGTGCTDHKPFARHHTKDYLLICYYNLKEKFMRGQKDFDILTFNRLTEFIESEGLVLWR